MFVGQIVLIFAEYALWGPPVPHPNPLAHQSIAVRFFFIVMLMPFLETIVGQWLPIRLMHGVFHLSWRVAAAGSIVLFTLMHGYTDRAVIAILLGAVVLATVFVIEAKRGGWPVLSTYLTHALANACVLSLQSG
ncbi:CPBP family intramembrane metalloprotease [Paraburkholderia sp. G-4-1-8]|uniref:CPBP family intramembrane metalloprotease n=2 Tax=Paraburkholderia antibiotica TaxID=2728839 RepID=A0A7X9X736_9BURK|nr:CPBP family intramembrane metalloprotease [Paraburkholderia antibiotica]